MNDERFVSEEYPMMGGRRNAGRISDIRTLETRIAIAENNDQNTLLVTVDVLKEILDALKDSESIVRCKDCVYGEPTGTTSLILCGLPYSGSPLYNINYYCADGKRK